MMNLKLLLKKENFYISKKRIIAGGMVLILVGMIVGWRIMTTYNNQKKSQHASVSILGVTKVNAGQRLTLPIIIDTKNQNINAAEVYLNFNPRLLRVDEVKTDGSFFKIWIQDQPKFSNEDGTLSFAGGLPKPGFTGRGQVGTVSVTLLKNQDATLAFTPKTRVLLNDGKATAIPLTMDPISIKVK